MDESDGVSRLVALLDVVAVVSQVWARFIAGHHEEGLATLERVRAWRRCTQDSGSLRSRILHEDVSDFIAF